MGFFQRLFSKWKSVVENDTQSEELKRLHELNEFMHSLLGGDHFVAKSEFQAKLTESNGLSTTNTSGKHAALIQPSIQHITASTTVKSSLARSCKY